MTQGRVTQGRVMQVTVNGDARTVPEGTTVDGLVDALEVGRKGVAVAVNAEVVPRSRWAATPLSPGDAVEVLRAAQGG